MKKNSALKFYLDTLELQAALGNAQLVKEADDGETKTLIDKADEYASAHIDPKDKTGSAINLLAPAVVFEVLSLVGFGWVGLVVSLAMEVFHVDVNAILSPILASIRGDAANGKKITSEEVESKVNEGFKAASAEKDGDDSGLAGWFSNPGNKFRELIGLPKDKSPADDGFKAHERNLRRAHLFRIELSEIEKNGSLKKTAAGRAKAMSWLAKAVIWVIKTFLVAGGFMVAGDVANKILGRPNAFDGNLQGGKPVEKAEVQSKSKQTKFIASPGKILNSETSTWVESVSPNESNIKNMVLRWMNEVYVGTQNYNHIAEESVGFKEVVQEITDYNTTNKSGNITFIPRMFISKKHAVDLFIDEVAEKSGGDNPIGKSPPWNPPLKPGQTAI